MSGYLPWGDVVQTGMAVFAAGVLTLTLAHLYEW
jgi:hypothetical protein